MTTSVRMFTAVEAAAYLGVCRESVLRPYRAGKLIGEKDGLAPGAPVRFRQDDLDTYKASRVRSNRPI